MTDLFDVDPISGRVVYVVDPDCGPFDHIGLSRSAHPDTSHEAARKVATDLPRRCAETLEALRAHPGLTAAELEEVTGVREGVHRKRLNDLRGRGRAEKGTRRRCRVTGHSAYPWRAK